MATRKKKKKVTKMSLNDFMENTPGRVQRQAALPSAPTGLDRRSQRGGRGGYGGGGRYDGGGGRGRYDGGGGGYGDDRRTRSDEQDNWRSGGGGRGGRDRGGDRGGFGRDRGDRDRGGGGFGRSGRGDEGGDDGFDRSAFGSKKQSSRGGFGGGGGFGRTNGGMRDRGGQDDNDRDFSRRTFGSAPQRPMRDRDPPRNQGYQRPGGGMESSRADESTDWRPTNPPRRPPDRNRRDPPAAPRDDGPALSRSSFGSRNPPPRREPRQRSPPRDRARPGMDDSSWRRKERREPSDWNSNRNRDRDGGGDRADQHDNWRNQGDRPRPSSSGFGRTGGDSGFGRSGFGRTTRRDDDDRGNFRDSPEPPKQKLPPQPIQVTSSKYKWDSKPTKASVAPVEPSRPAPSRPKETPRSKFLGSGGGVGASKFGGSGKGFGADILLNNEVTDSAEYHSRGSDFGRTRATFKTVGIEDNFPKKSLRGSGAPSPLHSRSNITATPAQEAFPQLAKRTPSSRPAQNSALQRRLNREAEEKAKLARQQERELKKAERERKLKIKAERIEKVNAALTKGNRAFQRPLGLDVIRTGTMELEIPEGGKSRKDTIKNLSILLVNSVISEEEDHANATFPKVLKFVTGHKSFEDDAKFSILVAVLKQLNMKTSEYKALELVGNTLERIFEVLDVNPEDPRMELEDLELGYLAPRVDVEALIHKCMEDFASATKTMQALNAGEGDAVSPELAERVVVYLWEQSFVKAATHTTPAKADPAEVYAEDVLPAFTELLNTVTPIQFLNIAVKAWFDKAPKANLKGMLQFLETKEVLQKQWLLDYQDDVAPKEFSKSKRSSLLKLTGWFNEIDAELNPPEEFSEDEEDESGSDEEESD